MRDQITQTFTPIRLWLLPLCFVQFIFELYQHEISPSCNRLTQNCTNNSNSRISISRLILSTTHTECQSLIRFIDKIAETNIKILRQSRNKCKTNFTSFYTYLQPLQKSSICLPVLDAIQVVSLTNIVRAGHPEQGPSILVPAGDGKPWCPSVGGRSLIFPLLTTHLSPMQLTSLSLQKLARRLSFGRGWLA